MKFVLISDNLITLTKYIFPYIISIARHVGICLQSQHLEGEGRRIMNSRSSWGTLQIWSQSGPHETISKKQNKTKPPHIRKLLPTIHTKEQSFNYNICIIKCSFTFWKIKTKSANLFYNTQESKDSFLSLSQSHTRSEKGKREFLSL